MDRNQEKTFQLLKEIDEICKENGIVYYLHEDAAAMALRDGVYVEDFLNVSVEMTTQDAEKFIQYVEKNPRDDRALEHMGNYEGYAGFNLKYIDVNTTYVPLNRYDNFKHKGIGVHIYLIRGTGHNRWKKKLWTALELGFEQNDFFLSRKPGKKEVFGKILVKALQTVFGKAAVKRYFFKQWMKDYTYSGKGSAMVRKAYAKKSFRYPEKLLKKTSYVMFEGMEFPVLGDAEEYVCLWRGKDWRKRLKGVRPSRELLLDSRIGYEELYRYLEQEGICLDDLKESHKVYRKQILEREKLAKTKTEYWEYAWNVRRNFMSDEQYAAKKEYIEALYENGAYMELLKELSFYNKVIKENIKYGYSRIGNERVHEIYKELVKIKEDRHVLENLSMLEK